MRGRWGIFGGLFDPVHRGHIHLASKLMSEAGLDGILWVPSARPPHKDKIQPAPFQDRVEMLRLVTGSLPNMAISEIESELELSGYALHTIRALKKRYPDADFCFIIGADNIKDIPNWYEYDQLLSEIDVVAGSRGGVKPESTDVSDNRIRYFEVEPIQIASNEVRKLIQNGATREELLGLLPEEALDYISTKNLYL